VSTDDDRTKTGFRINPLLDEKTVVRPTKAPDAITDKPFVFESETVVRTVTVNQSMPTAERTNASTVVAATAPDANDEETERRLLLVKRIGAGLGAVVLLWMIKSLIWSSPVQVPAPPPGIVTPPPTKAEVQDTVTQQTTQEFFSSLRASMDRVHP
jgi:hypothetical protein